MVSNPVPKESVILRKIVLSKPVGIALLLLFLLGGGWWWLKTKAAPRPSRPAEEKTQGQKSGRSGRAARSAGPVTIVPGTVVQKDVPVYVDGIGTVQALNTVSVRSRVDGQLVKVFFTEGQDVKGGDVLAQIDPMPFRTLLDQAMAKKNQDEVQLANARLDLNRYQEMVAKNVIARQQFDTQKALVGQLEAAVKTDQAAIDGAQVQLNYTTVTSPIDGRIGMRQMDVGNIIRASDTNGLVVITQLRPISVVFTLPEQNLNEIHRQASAGAPLEVLAVARDNNTLLAKGTLAVIDNQIDTTTGTIKLKATFPNEDLQLWPGQFVNVRLLLKTLRDGIVVPVQVIQYGPNGSYAFVIRGDQTVEMRPVKVAQTDNGEALISEGLRAGESIVVDGQYKLQEGSKVLLPDAAAGEGGGSAAPSRRRH